MNPLKRQLNALIYYQIHNVMISYCLLVTYVIAVTALSLKPTVDIQSIPYNDKLAHCLTYALFTFFVWRLSHSHFRFLLYALLVFTYSVLIEFIQPFTGRMLSGWDMVANGVGVIFMVLALYRVPLPIIK